MSEEDYFKYYIQGSDHYLIPRDIFEELFDEMSNWRDESKQLKEVIGEVREYVKNNDNFELADLYSQSIADEIQNKLLQILDKATKENK